MGEDHNLPTNGGEEIESVSDYRILVLMGVCVIIGGLIGFIFFGAREGLGVILGGLFGFANYFWLKKTVASAFQYASEGGKPSVFGAGYFLRYIALAIVLTIVYIADLVPITAVLVGLSSFAFAIVIEGFYRMLNSSN